MGDILGSTFSSIGSSGSISCSSSVLVENRSSILSNIEISSGPFLTGLGGSYLVVGVDALVIGFLYSVPSSL